MNARLQIAGLVLFLFLIFVMISIKFVKDPSGNMIEKFSNAPTRAADCNCLPGYIPAKNYKPNVFYYSGWNLFILVQDTYMYALFPGQCGLSINNVPEMSYTEMNKLEWRGYTNDCSLVNKTSNYYFCKKLSDPSVTRKCF